jgi:hypothetical protein
MNVNAGSVGRETTREGEHGGTNVAFVGGEDNDERRNRGDKNLSARPPAHSPVRRKDGPAEIDHVSCSIQVQRI